MREQVDGFSASAEDSRIWKQNGRASHLFSICVGVCEWAAEIGGGAGMKERSGWIQPDLKLHSTQQEKGRRVNV